MVDKLKNNQLIKMEKLTLTKIYRGKQVVKKGTPEEKEIDKIAIKTDKHGDKWLSSFKTVGTENWNEGDEISVIVTQKGDFLNFSLPDESNILEGRVTQLENNLKLLWDQVKVLSNPPNDDIPDKDEIPF